MIPSKYKNSEIITFSTPNKDGPKLNAKITCT